MMKKSIAVVACGVAVLTLGLSGCGASFEGSGSKDAASAEQLALRIDDPWAVEIAVDTQAKAAEPLADGVYTGQAPAMEGMVTVTLLIEDNHITCLEITQEGESQSRGGYEAIRDGKYALMIEAAQGSDIDAISGATITTAAIKNATEDALEQARENAGAQASGEVAVASDGVEAGTDQDAQATDGEQG